MAKFDSAKSYLVPTIFGPGDMGIYAIYPPDEESYFNSYWDTCREQFGKKFLETSLGFFFSLKDESQSEFVINFISKCEECLELDELSNFFLTDMKNVIFIIPSNFWKKCYMRRSLFSLICRQGLLFDGQHQFENLLIGNVGETKQDKLDGTFSFARKTRTAILRFFGGYCRYVGEGPERDVIFPEKHGWVHEFKEKPKSYVKKVLISDKPDLSYFFFDQNLFLS